MNQYIDALNTYLAAHPTSLGCGEIESLLGVLFRCYQESREMDCEAIRSRFNELDTILSKLPLEENNRVFFLTCELCELYRKEAFETGVVTGFHLLRELNT